MAGVVWGYFYVFVGYGLLEGYGCYFLGSCSPLASRIYKHILILIFILSNPIANLPKILQHIRYHRFGRHRRIDRSGIPKPFGKIWQAPTVIEMKMRNNDNIDIFIDITSLTADMPKIGVFLHVGVLHVDACVEYYCAIFYCHY